MGRFCKVFRRGAPFAGKDGEFAARVPLALTSPPTKDVENAQFSGGRMGAIRGFRRALLAGLLLGIGFAPVAHAEVSEVRISKGFGIYYLPLYVMQRQQLLE